jgi:hypothetical protein
MIDIFEELKDKNLIFQGSIISADVLENLFKLKRDSKEFVWKKLALKERIKMDGFFVTDKDCNEESFRILESVEMADYAEKKLEKNKNSNEKVALILKAHDISLLTEEQKRKHNFAQQKAARCASSMQEEMLKNQVL